MITHGIYIAIAMSIIKLLNLYNFDWKWILVPLVPLIIDFSIYIISILAFSLLFYSMSLIKNLFGLEKDNKE